MDKSLIDQTIKALRTNIEQLGKQRDDIDQEMARILAIIADWQEALALEDHLDNPPIPAKPKRVRVRKGHGSKIIAEYFADHPAPKTVQELSAATGLNQSTVSAVLAKAGSRYEKVGGKWRPFITELKVSPEQSGDTGGPHAEN